MMLLHEGIRFEMIMLARESIEKEPQINADERRLNALSEDVIGAAFGI